MIIDEDTVIPVIIKPIRARESAIAVADSLVNLKSWF